MTHNVSEKLGFENLIERSRGEADQKPDALEEKKTKFSTLLTRANSQANLGNWEAVFADAIAARDMDPHSVDAWKLCARAAFFSGDVDAALDFLFEALHIDYNNRETFIFLEEIVEDHLNRTLKVTYLNKFLTTLLII